MIRRPPRSPPFPYTRLFRSDVDLRGAVVDGSPPILSPGQIADALNQALGQSYASHDGRRITLASRNTGSRSEEHTSELQSRQYLVCRLLLEKKKERSPSGLT